MRVAGLVRIRTANVKVCHLGNILRRPLSDGRCDCLCDIGQLITFDMLPDDILITMFDFYVDKDIDDDLFYMDEDTGEDLKKQKTEEWMTLVHVCRRWRSLVFQSPRRLNLRLVCTHVTRVKDTLDIWPPLPLIIHDIEDSETSDVENTIAALEHNDRICQIALNCSYSEMEYLTDSAAILKPFPELKHLELGTNGGDGPILPDSFLGGTAQRLRSLDLYRISFPGLPKLLLSATRLVNLNLHDTPHSGSGYIPPEAMATGLAALISLEYICLYFGYQRPAQESRRLPQRPQTRSILPSLTKIRFERADEYLEEFLARIDAPRLNGLRITFSTQSIHDTPQLFQFISRTPTLRAPKKGHIAFSFASIVVKFPLQTTDLGVLSVKIPSMTTSEWRVSRLEQVCTLSLPPVSTLEDLYIVESPFTRRCRLGDVENMLWLRLLHPFSAVKNLYLCKKFVPRIAPALGELVGARTTEVLPALENLFLEGLQTSGPSHVGIEQLVSARRPTGHPVAVSCWDKDSEWKRQVEIYHL